MRELLILRHGVSVSNEQRTFTGGTDVPLCAAGEAALAQAAGQYPRAVRFFTSGMLRARQTLDILYGQVPREDIPQLAECCLGVFEGRTHDMLFEAEPLYREWLARGGAGDMVVPPGGESRVMFDARVAKGFHSLTARHWDGLAVLVTHGGVIRSILKQFVRDAPPVVKTQNGNGWHMTLGPTGNVTSYSPWEIA